VTVYVIANQFVFFHDLFAVFCRWLLPKLVLFGSFSNKFGMLLLVVRTFPLHYRQLHTMVSQAKIIDGNALARCVAIPMLLKLH